MSEGIYFAFTTRGFAKEKVKMLMIVAFRFGKLQDSVIQQFMRANARAFMLKVTVRFRQNCPA